MQIADDRTTQLCVCASVIFKLFLSTLAERQDVAINMVTSTKRGEY